MFAVSLFVDRLTVSASNLDELEKGLPTLRKLIKEAKMVGLRESKGKGTVRGPHVYAYCARTGETRFRRTREELAQGLSEESAAKKRLAKLGK